MTEKEREKGKELMKKIEQLLSGTIDEVLLNASVESKVVKRKGEFMEMSLVLLISDNESLSVRDNKLVLRLDADAYELINDLLEGILDGEQVMPEITDIYMLRSGKKKKD